MLAADFVRRLEGMGLKVRRDGPSQWNAQCPAHEDKTPSLSISEGKESKVLLDCKAGCRFAEIVRAAGLEERDMFQSNKPNYKPGQKYKEPTRYEIRDVQDKLVVCSYRLDLGYKDKIFWWERNGKKGLSGLRLEDLPLYRSQDIPGFDKARPVFVTEGAKDCDALRSLGLQALGTVSSANVPPSHPVLATLKGLRVVLWPDHDEVGYAHMREIAKRLKGVATKISFLLPSSPNKADGAFDWTQKARKGRATPEGIRETLEGDELLGEALPHWGEEPKAKDNTNEPGDFFSSSASSKKAAQEGPDLDHLAPLGADVYTLAHLDQARERELLSLAELPRAEDAEARPAYGWGERFNELIGGGLSPGDLVALGASSAGAGKTAFLMQLIDGLALRSSFLIESNQEGPLTPVLLLSEMAAEALVQRRLAWLTGEKTSTWRAGKTVEKRTSKGEVDGLYHHARRLREIGTLGRVLSWSRQVNRSAIFEAGSQMVPLVRSLVSKWRSQLEEQYEREVWPVVVFDPIQRALRQDKNEVEAQNEAVRQIDAAAEEDRWLCFLTSDTNKAAAKGEAQGDASETGAALLRGSYALIHGADVACFLGKPEEKKEGATHQAISLTLFKNRYGPGFESILYHWEKFSGRFREFSPQEIEERKNLKPAKPPKNGTTKDNETENEPNPFIPGSKR